MKKKSLQGSNAPGGSKPPERNVLVNPRRFYRQKGAGTVEYMLLTGLMVAALLTPFGEEGESVQQRLMNAIRDQQEAFHYAARLPHMPTLDAEGNIVGSDEPLNGGPFDQRLPGGETGTSSNAGGAGNGASNGGPYGDSPYGGGESSSNGIWGSDGIEGQGQSSVEGGFSGPSIEDILQQADQSALDDKAQFMQCRQERVVAAQQEANRMPANSAQQTELQATAERLRANTVAQEHYGLFEHLHSPGQPAPAGWQDVGNSQASLNQAKLSPSRLTSKQSDFRAGMYTPDRDVLGGDFSPTLKSTGFPEATKGWLNGAQQANRFQPDAYDRHVQLTSKMRVASPSQVAGGAGVTPLTSGLSATAIEREKTPVVHSVLGADFSNLAGSDMPTDPTANALAGDSSANSPCFEDGVVEVSQSTSTAGLSARSRPGAERIQEIDQQLERDGEALSESERQALEEERQAIFTLRRSRNEALETACHYWAGSREACQFERSLLYYEFLTWGEPNDLDGEIFHYYRHTATLWGDGEQDRITSIARQALTDIVIDTVTAPLVIGRLVGQAYAMDDEEFRAILREMGDEIKAFKDNPAAYISESIREQFAYADALEQAGQRDEADLVRMRVILQNHPVIFGMQAASGVGAVKLAADLPTWLIRVVKRRGSAEADGNDGDRNDGDGSDGDGNEALSNVPGRVQSRINLATGDSSSGWIHVVGRHFNPDRNASQFTVSQSDLRTTLQSPEVVNTPVTRTLDSAEHGTLYVREIDLGRAIGTDKFNSFQTTSTMTVMTDRFGNLVTATPGSVR
ncbi:hypothetical protein ACU6TU_13510 [Halomonas sp. LS-001]